MKKKVEIFMQSFWTWFLVLIGLLSIVSIFPAEYVSKNIHPYALNIIIGIVVFAIFYWLYKSYSPKKIIIKNIDESNSLITTIKFGNILEEEGVSVISVNEYFDTKVDGTVVNWSTVHWKFINKYFKENLSDLNSQIKKGLKEIEYENNSSRSNWWKQNKYPIGTSVRIETRFNWKQKSFILIVLTKFDNNHKAYIWNNRIETIDNYDLFTKWLLTWIKILGAGEKINIPLIWNWISGFHLKDGFLLQYILWLLSKYSELLGNRISEFNIILYGKNINLNEFKDFKI